MTCACGCGEVLVGRGRFNRGHHKAGKAAVEQLRRALREERCVRGVAPGCCLCGCGAPVAVATRTKLLAKMVKGEPRRYIIGHQARLSPLEYVVDEAGCWIWQRGVMSAGYGMGHVGRVKILAHRLIWERENGPIPEGCDLHHTCRVRTCVNPDHLEVIDRAEHGRLHSLDQLR